MPILDQKTSYQRYPKPPYSYAGMIVLAIENSPEKRLTLAQIQKSLGEMFHFFREVNYTGWKDSVRHNLSQDKCFKKMLKDPHRANSKGNFWIVDLAMVSPDVFIRQETDVARTGLWAFELHHQVGLQPVTLKPALSVGQKEVVFPYPLAFNSSPDFARTSSPMMPQKNLNLKRKAISTGCLEDYDTEEPKAKRQKRFSFSIASILRLRSHINAKISKVKKSKQNGRNAILENRSTEATPNCPDWMQYQAISEEPVVFPVHHLHEIPEFAETTRKSTSSLPASSALITQMLDSKMNPHQENYLIRRDQQFDDRLQNSNWLPTYEDFKHPLQPMEASSVSEPKGENRYAHVNWPIDYSHNVYPAAQFANFTQSPFPCYEQVLI